jgi:hypothetical protein
MDYYLSQEFTVRLCALLLFLSSIIYYYQYSQGWDPSLGPFFFSSGWLGYFLTLIYRWPATVNQTDDPSYVTPVQKA